MEKNDALNPLSFSSSPIQLRKEEKQPMTKFAGFFRAYAFGLSVIVASLPILISIYDLMPMFANIKNPLTIITSLTSYLLVGYLFFMRHAFASAFFPGHLDGDKYILNLEGLSTVKNFNWLPVALIFFSLVFCLLYYSLVDSAAKRVALSYSSEASKADSALVSPIWLEGKNAQTAALTRMFRSFGLNDPIRVETRPPEGKNQEPTQDVVFYRQETINGILRFTPSASVPLKFWLALSFILIFHFSSAAFIVMGLKDYLQKELGLAEKLLFKPIKTILETFEIPGADSLFGKLEYSPLSPAVSPRITGPYCKFHDQLVELETEIVDGKTKHQALHKIEEKDGPRYVRCPVAVNLQPGKIKERMRESAHLKFEACFQKNEGTIA